MLFVKVNVLTQALGTPKCGVGGFHLQFIFTKQNQECKKKMDTTKQIIDKNEHSVNIFGNCKSKFKVQEKVKCLFLK